MNDDELARRLQAIEDSLASLMSEVGTLGGIESKLIDVEEHLANIEHALWPDEAD